ncbi:MAG: hypothetical protein AB1689_04595 [Thermodesulfobacteriota bacterium]
MLPELWWQALIDGVRDAWNSFGDTVAPEGVFSRDSLERLLRVSYPVAPFNRPEVMAPLLGLAGVLLSIVLAGVAVSSLLSMVAALLALGLLLSRFFGVTLELGAVAAS